MRTRRRAPFEFPVPIGFLALLVLAAGCAGGDDATADSAEPPQAAPTTEAPATGRDIAGLDLCATVPGADVATALGAELGEPAPHGGYDSVTGAHCWYALHPEGSGRSVPDQYIVYVMSPSMHTPPESNAEPVSGLGDEAIIAYDEGEEQYRLAVLKRGDFALEIMGRERQRTIDLASLVLSRL